jgi:hypothetical protein
MKESISVQYDESKEESVKASTVEETSLSDEVQTGEASKTVEEEVSTDVKEKVSINVEEAPLVKNTLPDLTIDEKLRTVRQLTIDFRKTRLRFCYGVCACWYFIGTNSRLMA